MAAGIWFVRLDDCLCVKVQGIYRSSSRARVYVWISSNVSLEESGVADIDLSSSLEPLDRK